MEIVYYTYGNKNFKNNSIWLKTSLVIYSIY